MNRVVASVVLVLVMVAGSLYMRVDAPCSWFHYASASDVPARCLMNPGR